MYYIVENQEQFNYLLASSEKQCYINVISLNDNVHPKLTSPCLVYYKVPDEKGYIICVDHSESFSIDFDHIITLLRKYDKIYLLDKKYHSYFLPLDLPTIDLNFSKLEKDNDVFDLSDCDTPVHEHFYREHGTKKGINKIIPISKHYEKQENIYEKLKKEMSAEESNLEYYNELVSTFYNIEKNGIGVDTHILKNNFEPGFDDFSIKNNKIYTCFNLYNLTGRPTNHFNNINFAALPKEGKGRASFIPVNNTLVEFDFDGYHVRIIAKLIRYEIGADSAHKQLASLYYNTPAPTQENVDSAKKITFKQLYGSIDDKLKNITFFKDTGDFIDGKWDEFNENGYVELAGGRKLYNDESLKLNKTKLFNYIIQSYETYYNVEALRRVLEYLKDKKSKIIHYTYDSFLFDVDKDEGGELLRNIKGLLEEYFPCKISYGKNYKNMEKLIK